MRRLRGFLGTMAVWAVAVVALGLASTTVLRGIGLLPRFVFHWLPWAITGANMGLIFATAIVLGERRKTIEALSPRRLAAWGFLAGATVPFGVAAIDRWGWHSPGLRLWSAVVWSGIFGVTSAALALANLRAARLSRDVAV